MKNFVSQNIAIHPIAKADGLSGDGIVIIFAGLALGAWYLKGYKNITLKHGR
jgi:hypothetical protein